MRAVSFLWKGTGPMIDYNGFFMRLYREYYDKVYTYCLVRLNGRHDLAADCVQNTFFAAFRNIEKLATHENIGGWRYTSARNYVLCAVQQLRRERNNVRLNHDIPSNIDFVTEIEGKHTMPSCATIMAALSDAERELHRLYFAADKRTAEIAELLGISDGAVRVRIHRLRRKIYNEIRTRASL
jgi:RNA polymerase sigma-70 factor (ECF subfamily)